MLEEIRTKLDRIITEIVAPAAGEVDRGGKFPETAVAALLFNALSTAFCLGLKESGTAFIGRASCALPVFA